MSAGGETRIFQLAGRLLGFGEPGAAAVPAVRAHSEPRCDSVPRFSRARRGSTLLFTRGDFAVPPVTQECQSLGAGAGSNRKGKTGSWDGMIQNSRSLIHSYY